MEDEKDGTSPSPPDGDGGTPAGESDAGLDSTGDDNAEMKDEEGDDDDGAASSAMGALLQASADASSLATGGGDDEAAAAGNSEDDKAASEGKDGNNDGPEGDSMDVDQDTASKEEGETKGEDAAEAAIESNEMTTEDSSLKDLPYSTRGRSSGEEKSDRGSAADTIKETLEELSRPKEAPGVSFLEALSEEERRMRTRFLPDVEGMHVLRKNEVKDDIALAKSLPTIMSAQGNFQRRAGRLAAAGRRKDAMVVDGEEVPFYDERTTKIELPTSELTIPSDAFVAPEGVSVGDNEGTIAFKKSDKARAKAKPPSQVETTVAFNPPRPPESIGGKKKHRVLRWERRPDDIDVDMKNYRRTVQRTRQELQKSEAEFSRLETIDAHLRRHFLSHLDVLNEEHKQLHDEVQSEVQKLIKVSDLAGSRTRSKNLSKAGVVMRDVLSMLQKNESSDASMQDAPAVSTTAVATEAAPPGIGGLNAKAFVDWNRSTDIEVMKPAISWVEAGQVVKTPDGEGVVVTVIPAEVPKDNTTSGTAEADPMALTAADEAIKGLSAAKVKVGVEATAEEEQVKKVARGKEQEKYKSLLPVRVTVRLSDREATFNMDSISLLENPAHYSDAKLATRWKAMIESALQVGPCVDLQGLTSIISPAGHGGESESDANKGTSPMDVEGGATAGTKLAETDKSFLPVDASLIPTVAGRGNFLYGMKIGDIENGLHDALYDGHGVLGMVRFSLCCVFVT